MPRKPRTVFTQEQSMINHYEVVLIEAAASETGLDIQTIKVCEITKTTFPKLILIIDSLQN